MRRRAVRYLPAGVVTLLTLAIVVLATAAATRPARLDHAVPGDGGQLGRPPVAVTLAFTAALDPAQVHVAVADPAGVSVTSVAPVVSGGTVVQRVSIATVGRYRIGYHVVTTGGRTLTGSSTFTVEGAGPAAATPAAAEGSHAHGATDPLTGLIALLAVVVGVALLLAGRRHMNPLEPRYMRLKTAWSLPRQTAEGGESTSWRVPPHRGRDVGDRGDEGPAGPPTAAG